MRNSASKMAIQAQPTEQNHTIQTSGQSSLNKSSTLNEYRQYMEKQKQMLRQLSSNKLAVVLSAISTNPEQQEDQLDESNGFMIADYAQEAVNQQIAKSTLKHRVEKPHEPSTVRDSQRSSQQEEAFQTKDIHDGHKQAHPEQV